MKRITFSALPLLLLLAVGACSRPGGVVPAAAPVPVDVVTLRTAPVTLTRELAGRTTASAVAEVRPQVSGIVERRLFTEGTTVRAGAPLYQLDDDAYRAETNGARAQLARAEATLVTARLNAKRSAEVVRIGAVSQQDDDAAQAALRQAEADVRAARAAVDAAAVTLRRARITAPITGRIGRSSVTQGALVTAGQTEALATVQQIDPVYVDLVQSATELLALRKALAAGTLGSAAQTPVRVLLDDGTEYPHPGRLAFSEVAVDPSTGAFALRVVVPNPDGVLMPGMYVRAVVGRGQRADAILVPQRAVMRDAKGNTTAFVVAADGTAAARAIHVSQAIGDAWLLEDGLAAGDRVIVAGLQKVQPGVPVRATEVGTAVAPPTSAASHVGPAVGAPGVVAAR